MIEIRKPDGAFGVTEIVGVEPGGSGDDAPGLQSVLAEVAVVCLRMERALADEELQAVARLFGPIKDPVGRAKDGSEFRYSEPRQIIDSGFVMTDEIRDKLGDLSFGGLDDERPGLFETFHCDDTYTEEPAAATILHARALPPSGGGPTCSLDMRAAYELLHEPTRRQIEGLRVVHAYNNADAFPPRRAAHGPADVLVWDNASVQHKAGGDFAVGEPRRFWRYMIAGGLPE